MPIGRSGASRNGTLGRGGSSSRQRVLGHCGCRWGGLEFMFPERHLRERSSARANARLVVRSNARQRALSRVCRAGGGFRARATEQFSGVPGPAPCGVLVSCRSAGSVWDAASDRGVEVRIRLVPARAGAFADHLLDRGPRAPPLGRTTSTARERSVQLGYPERRERVDPPPPRRARARSPPRSSGGTSQPVGCSGSTLMNDAGPPVLVAIGGSPAPSLPSRRDRTAHQRTARRTHRCNEGSPRVRRGHASRRRTRPRRRRGGPCRMGAHPPTRRGSHQRPRARIGDRWSTASLDGPRSATAPA